MRAVKFAPVISHLGLLALASLALSLAPLALRARAIPELSLWLVGARLALGATFAIAVPCALLLALELRLARGRLAATAALMLGMLPLVWPIAAYLAGGDGLRARGLPAPLVQAVVLVLLEATAVAVWTYRYWARARPLDLLLGASFFAGLLACAALLRRAQLELSLCLEGAALVLCVLVLQAAGRDRQVWVARVAQAGLLGIAALVLAGFAQPSALARGRRLALLSESGLALVAGAFMPAPPAPAIPTRTSARCQRALTPARWPALTLPPEQRRNVIFISIDSVRADFVRRARPDGTPAMPAVAQFMDESRVARPAHAAFPATLMSLASAFTGALPSDLLLTPHAYPTLFQLTRGRFDHAEVVLPGSRYFARPDVRAQLLTDVEVFSEGGSSRQTRYAIDLLRTLREQGKSHFVWLHYFDPHEPYDKHEGYDFGDDDVARYMSELAYVDEQLDPLLELLRSEGWYDDSLIALFSDHGEAFGEHGQRYHHYQLYSWLLSVPFALHAPGLAPGLFQGPVQLTDLTPTVMQFVGMHPWRPLRGRALLAGDPPADRALFSEEIAVNGRLLQAFRERPVRSEADVQARMQRIERGPGYASKIAVTRAGMQLVQHRAERAGALYDVARDPRAERDLAEARAERAAELSATLAALRSDMLLRAACELTRPAAAR